MEEEMSTLVLKGEPTLLAGSLRNLWEKVWEPIYSETLWKGTCQPLEDHRPPLPLFLLLASVTTPLWTLTSKVPHELLRIL